ncbi:MAG TPA: patatin-like phospholipase family protein [Nitrospira sp.]|nr:patatin-like phospholipase family protein [Nitrospira sp.]
MNVIQAVHVRRPRHTVLVLSRCLIVLAFVLNLGCSYFRPTLNDPLTKWEPAGGYRFINLAPPDADNSDSLIILAAFSGGGTRASTLAFGALRELAQQRIVWEGKEKRLLDEVDVIHALSGGTFTAGYYALYRDQIFHDFEYRFLRKDWEKELKERVFQSPSNWIRLWSPYFGRAHLLAELLDEALFDHKTYADLAAHNQRPFLIIHSSDMATLSRFEFNQLQFDLICSDLYKLPIAMASASSAALPLVLSPISLKNFAGNCAYEVPAWLEQAKERGGIGGQRANELLSYLDTKKRPYIHLLDGGLSDNLALRGILEGSGVAGNVEALLKQAGVKNVRKFVVLAVNAETSPDVMEFRSDHVPVLSKAMNSLIDVPINRYSFDTVALLRLGIQKWQEMLKLERPEGSPFAPGAEIYFINASLAEVPDLDERASLMRIPTTLYLKDEQIDRLVRAASSLIRNDPDFRRLMRDIEREAQKRPAGP